MKMTAMTVTIGKYRNRSIINEVNFSVDSNEDHEN